jgi:nucleotide sugar dehydrogenase
MKIGVIGAGRLGICFALLAEKAGYQVLVSDIREDYVNNLNLKNIITNEPKVSDLLRSSSKLRATTDNKKVIEECDIIYTLVSTPSLPSGSYDISAVWQVVEDFKTAEFSVAGKSFVIGCTTNPGDCELFQKELSDLEVDVFYNPEFIAQGSIIKDLLRADMVLIGGPETEHRQELVSLYNRLQETTPNISLMSTTAAEIVKLATNCFLTTKISYANLVGETIIRSGLKDEVNVVLSAIGADSRVGSKYMRYGYGYGGPCLPRDNRAFAAYSKSLGIEHNLGYTTDKINEEHANFILEHVIQENTNDLPFYISDIAYKAGTDILTESQQYRLVINLLDAGKTVYIGQNPSANIQVREYLEKNYGEKVSFANPEEEVFVVEL